MSYEGRKNMRQGLNTLFDPDQADQRVKSLAGDLRSLLWLRTGMEEARDDLNELLVLVEAQIDVLLEPVNYER